MAELEVGDGEEVVGRPAGGSKTLAVVEMGRTALWWPRDVELWPGGACVGRGPGGGGGGAPRKNW